MRQRVTDAGCSTGDDGNLMLHAVPPDHARQDPDFTAVNKILDMEIKCLAHSCEQDSDASGDAPALRSQ